MQFYQIVVDKNVTLESLSALIIGAEHQDGSFIRSMDLTVQKMSLIWVTLQALHSLTRVLSDNRFQYAAHLGKSC